MEEKNIEEKKTKGAIKKAKTKTQRKDIIAAQRSAIKNPLALYDKRADTINAFVIKHILPGDLEKDLYYKFEESEPEFKENMAERTKMRRQKSYKENQQGQILKILTLYQMLSRLPISLARLKAGNNLEKLKNEIRQLLTFSYRL